jgi:hypothetical protein
MMAQRGGQELGQAALILGQDELVPFLPDNPRNAVICRLTRYSPVPPMADRHTKYPTNWCGKQAAKTIDLGSIGCNQCSTGFVILTYYRV